MPREIMNVGESLSCLVVIMVLVLASCHADEHERRLLPASAESCRPEAYLLELPPGRDFVLNGELRDSVGVMRWIRDVLPRRDSTGRFVNVRADVGRDRDLKWLVPAIRDAGGRAFRSDSSCHVEVATAPLASRTTRSPFSRLLSEEAVFAGIVAVVAGQPFRFDATNA